MKRITLYLFVVLSIIAMAMTVRGNAAGPEVVHFPTATLPPSNAGSGETTDAVKSVKPQPIWGHLGKPKGTGPFPAVVMMHGCGGIQESHLRWAKLLNAAGYVTLVLDSYRPRSIVRVCNKFIASVSEPGRTLEFLQHLAMVDDDRIGLMGWSHGGGSALAAIGKHGIVVKFSRRFKTAIAFYPFCVSNRSFETPTLILIGSDDDWTPADFCRKLLVNNQQRGNNLTLAVYDGAFHGFDDADLGSGFFIPGEPGGRHWLQYNKTAHQDAVRKVKRFLADHLSR